MKTQRFLIKQLTAAEVGTTNTNETYIRCPNNFDYVSFFQQNGTVEGTVKVIMFQAKDLTNGPSFGSWVNLRFAFYINNTNQEKRIPGLTPLFRSRNVVEGDFVKIVSSTENGSTSFTIQFFKPNEFKMLGTSTCYEEIVAVDGTTSNTIPDALYNEYWELLRENHNLVLTGAPGTGKTYLAKVIAQQLGAETQFVQFHPSYDYTDFVEGLRPNIDPDSSSNNSGIAFRRKDGIFKCFCKKAYKSLQNEETKDKPYVFIIDEINRGEISKIFGELFFAIDPGYRGEKGLVSTQYQELITDNNDIFKRGFYVPENVYIIGTMNDIDRSVESMDFAIRRRFAWREVSAEQSAENMGLSDDIKVRMNKVNQAIHNCDLTPAYYIGGAYFLKLKGDDYESLWNNHIKGLVEEYFRGNPDGPGFVEKIHKALVEE